MKKTNSYFKKRRFLRNMIIIVIIQILLIIVAFAGFSGRQEATSDNTTDLSFIPDNVVIEESIGIGRLSQSESSIVIIHDAVRYFFDDDCMRGWYFREDLVNELSKDELHISYMTDTHCIVDIRSKTKIYYTIDDYNSEQKEQIIAGCIVFSFAELVFLCCTFFYIAIEGPIRKILKHPKRRK